MSPPALSPPAIDTPWFLAILIILQCFCSVFFVSDVMMDIGAPDREVVHLFTEAIATLALIAAIIIELRYMLVLLRTKARLEQSVHLASAAVSDVIDAHFDFWNLSPAERDVATFLVKGMSISEIAELRGNKEGTIKAHLNVIYRKSGTKNRGEMLSELIDVLISLKPGKTAPN